MVYLGGMMEGFGSTIPIQKQGLEDVITDLKNTLSTVQPSEKRDIVVKIIEMSNSLNQSPSLYGADLSGADLSGANLTNVNLSNADLRGANLTNTNLSGADLRGASLLWTQETAESITQKGGKVDDTTLFGSIN